jgi:alanine racemase
MKISRPIRARIDPAAIRHNYRIANTVRSEFRAWAVIKAIRYGHGQWRAVEALRGGGRWLCHAGK